MCDGKCFDPQAICWFTRTRSKQFSSPAKLFDNRVYQSVPDKRALSVAQVGVHDLSTPVHHGKPKIEFLLSPSCSNFIPPERQFPAEDLRPRGVA